MKCSAIPGRTETDKRMNPDEETKPLPTKSGAFFKVGCGCLLVFGVLAALGLLIGGQIHADPPEVAIPLGIVMLFLIGGGLGLLVRWIYLKGFDAGRHR